MTGDDVAFCIDDASRLAFAEIMPDEKKESAIAFLKAARTYYRKFGIRVERVMTDNVLRAEGDGQAGKVSLSASMLSRRDGSSTANAVATDPGGFHGKRKRSRP